MGKLKFLILFSICNLLVIGSSTEAFATVKIKCKTIWPVIDCTIKFSSPTIIGEFEKSIKSNFVIDFQNTYSRTILTQAQQTELDSTAVLLKNFQSDYKNIVSKYSIQKSVTPSLVKNDLELAAKKQGFEFYEL